MAEEALADEGSVDDVTEADVEVTWYDGNGNLQSFLLAALSLSSLTLGDLRQLCAEKLHVERVEAKDYNDGMDSMSLLELGIGSSALPFEIEVDGCSPSMPSSIADSSDTSAPKSKIPAGADPKGTSRSFAERNALKDAVGLRMRRFQISKMIGFL
eukprot:TRINITY_DN97557_c0_g1_i2.p1 TRINITY_DN97557_c0_g1~~TRINITY_DN97557_c0_g1_i2.p1  ORF type:complete len:156 (+),score=34.29 TRINITY_DN97557_c0_g1_i2:47-514(+)